MADLGPIHERLIRLMTGAPLSDLSEAQIVETARTARQARRDAEGHASAELHRRGWTWEKIGDAFDVSQSTAFRWAQPYL